MSGRDDTEEDHDSSYSLFDSGDLFLTYYQRMTGRVLTPSVCRSARETGSFVKRTDSIPPKNRTREGVS